MEGVAVGFMDWPRIVAGALRSGRILHISNKLFTTKYSYLLSFFSEFLCLENNFLNLARTNKIFPFPWKVFPFHGKVSTDAFEFPWTLKSASPNHSSIFHISMERYSSHFLYVFGPVSSG